MTTELRFVVRALLVATSVGLLVVTFPVLETAQLAFAGYVLGSISAEEAPPGRRRALAAAACACLVVGILVAGQVAGMLFRIGGRPDRWPGAAAVTATPTVFVGLLLGFWLIAWQARVRVEQSDDVGVQAAPAQGAVRRITA